LLRDKKKVVGVFVRFHLRRFTGDINKLETIKEWFYQIWNEARGHSSAFCCRFYQYESD
jgi:hypothetical protein